MTHRTDDDLGRLLEQTFRSREGLADPDTARALARSVGGRSPRRWPAYVAAAAAIVLVAVLATVPRTADDSRSPVAGPNPSPSAPRTYAGNRALAAAESARVVELVPLPTGSRRLAAPPPEWPRDAGTSLGSGDDPIIRVSWWSVPGSAAPLEEHLLATAPAGMHQVGGVGSGYDGRGGYIRDLAYDQDQPTDPDAFTGVSLLVQWISAEGRTLVRASAFTLARDVRSPETYLDETVTAVDIDRVMSTSSLHNRVLPTGHLTNSTDRQAIAGLVRTVNALRPSVRPPVRASCPFPGDPRPSVTLTFHTADGLVRMHLEESCAAQVEITRDGVPLEPTLDPGDLAAVVDQVLADHR